ncbi:MAG: NAD+ synthase [Phycisphaerae bacterium]|nr:NAD+ synthase [Phycisphaerae bacterium]
MKAALVQLNPIVGDIDGNTDKIIDGISRARDASADLAIFTELAITGYPPRDLLLKDNFVERNLEALERITVAARGIAVLVGYVKPNETGQGQTLHNAAGLVVDGKLVGTHLKALLPTYDVFDEHRYFEPGKGFDVYAVPTTSGLCRIGITICEDLWNNEQFTDQSIYEVDPVAMLAAGGADLLVNLSASPYWSGKQRDRAGIFGRQIREHRVPLLYVNQVGGNDDLIFDGASAAFSPDGSIVAQAAAFEEDLLLVDVPAVEGNRLTSYPDDVAAIHRALVMGTRDYVDKCGFKAVLVGLSGGIDSAVTAALAAEALGPDRVYGVALPSRYSSDHSLTDAEALACSLGIDYRVIEIEGVHRAMEAALAGHFGDLPPGIAEENIQARIRGNILMALSNKFGWMVLTTGNKSEMAVGYCTLYGDMCGGLAVLSDVPKTMVYKVAEHMNVSAGRELIPENTITKPPSAELKPDQVDQDSLPPYDVLDRILQLYVEQEQSVSTIVSQGFAEPTVREVARMVDRNEYKRKQAPVGLKVTSRAFGTGRRMPIVARYP